jgi:hypothetical protein
MRKLLRRLILLAGLLISLRATSQNLIQATLKMGDAPNKVDVWLRPNFTNNNVHNLFQIGLPIAWPAKAPVQPTGISVIQDPGFVATFGNNYLPTINPIASSTNLLEKYITVFLVRLGNGASNPQSWTSGVEFKVLTIVFDNPVGSPGSPVKLADYQDGGSSGQGNFYTQDESNNFYVTTNSIGNFYSSPGQSTITGNNSTGSIQTNFIVPVSCTPPSLTVNNNSTTSADIDWPVISGATGYEYYISTSMGAPAAGTPITTNTFNAPGLSPATQYFVYVRTNCGSGSFSSWANMSFTTPSTPCNAPSTPIANPVGIATADINWNVVSGATGYEYVLSTSSATPGSLPGTGTPTASTTFSTSSLTGGTRYYFFVRTNCGSGNYSNWVSTNFITQPALCIPPSAPTFGPITTTTAEINWNAVSGSAGYEYVISSISGIPGGSGTSITGTSLTASALTPDITYYVYIRNNCGGGSYSTWSSASFNTVCPTPGAVTVPSATITSTSAIINWPSTGAASYQYDVSTSTSPTTLTPSTGGKTTSGTTHTETGLAAGITYYAYVRSICSANNFSEWQKVSFATICTQPATATITGISPATPTAATITWPEIPDVNGYQYLVSTSNTPPQAGTPTIFTSISPSNLAQGTQYFVYVRTECSPGVYSVWTTTPFTTVFPPCNPAGPITINVNGSTGTFTWPSIAGVMGYEYAITKSSTTPTSWTFISGTSVQMNNLSSNTQYYIHLRTKCGDNRYSISINKNFTTSCFKPILFIKGNDIVGGTADLGWYAISGALKYEYAILKSAAPPSGSSNFAIDTLLRVNDLKPGMKYYLHVRTHCSPTNISEWSTLSFYNSGIAISPNPAEKKLTIALYSDDLHNDELELFDAVGKLLKKIKIIGGVVDINLDVFAQGMYYVICRQNNNIIYKTRFIKIGYK